MKCQRVIISQEPLSDFPNVLFNARQRVLMDIFFTVRIFLHNYTLQRIIDLDINIILLYPQCTS